MTAYTEQSIPEASLTSTGTDHPGLFDPSFKYKVGDRFSKDGSIHKVIQVSSNGLFTANEATLQQLKWAW